MEIEVRYFAGCPSWRLAHRRVVEALVLLGRAETPVVSRAIATDEEADAVGFAGSPSIVVDGRDLFPSAGGARGLTCRVYPVPGGLEGAPTREQLVRALTVHDARGARDATADGASRDGGA